MSEADAKARRSGRMGLRRPSRELVTRAISAVVLVALVAFETVIGGWWFLQFLCLAAIISFWEWNGMTLKRMQPGPGSLAIRVFLSLPTALVLSTLVVNAAPIWAYVAAAAGWSLVSIAIIIWRSPAGRRVRNITWYLVGIPYITLPFVAIWAIRETPVSGLLTLFFVFIVVWTTDTAAYFVGRALKGPKLAPAISPGKTWSGAIGGLSGAVLIGGLLAFWTGGDHQFGFILLVVALMSIGSQFGDLMESAVKRRSGVKDSGRLIPGHGGVLDRIDGLMIAVVIAFAFQSVNSLCLDQTPGNEGRAGLLCAGVVDLELDSSAMGTGNG
ncbi:MAG: phosphatidate cytidylyltransferase [Pseudomonadota bacterium]